MAANQLARFGEVCRIYAPLYRQATLGAITRSQEPDRALAYDDVVDSFRHYMGQWNEGRPFILIGHSQGSGLLTRMIAAEIDTDEALRRSDGVGAAHRQRGLHTARRGRRRRLPERARVPSARPDRLCHQLRVLPGDARRGVDGFFGEHDEDGTPICANPAALEGGPAEVGPLFAADNAMQLAAGGAPVETPWVQYPGLATVECITNDTHTYLAVTVNADPDDPRIDDVGGDFLPGWGLHIIDMNLAIADLVAVVAQQSATVN